MVLERGSAEHGLPLRLPSLDIVIQDWVGPERTPWLVKLRFNGVRGVELEGFDQQNVVFELEVTALPEGEDAVSWKTVCSASVGFNGASVSDEVEVVSVEMLDAPR